MRGKGRGGQHRENYVTSSLSGVPPPPRQSTSMAEMEGLRCQSAPELAPLRVTTEPEILGEVKPNGAPPSHVHPPCRRRKSRSLAPQRCRFGSHGPLAISFSGAGFMGAYHLGAAMALASESRLFQGRVVRLAGASAGSLTVAALALAPDSLIHCLRIFLDLADEVRKHRMGTLSPKFSLSNRVEEGLRETLQGRWDPDKAATVYVSLTCMACSPRRNVLTNRFASLQEFITAILASAHVPVYSGRQPYQRIWGIPMADGGLTDNLPTFPDMPTITVCPFASTAHISPVDPPSAHDLNLDMRNLLLRLNGANLTRIRHAFRPPKREQLLSYARQGYRDAVDFLRAQRWHIAPPPLTASALAALNNL